MAAKRATSERRIVAIKSHGENFSSCLPPWEWSDMMNVVRVGDSVKGETSSANERAD
jgi:hypothetical protein